MNKLTQWKEQIARLDAKLHAIANRPVVSMVLNWLFNLGRFLNPLEEAGVKAETEQLLSELIEYYSTSGHEMRQAIRKLFADHRSFEWATMLPYRPITEASFRAHLILFSMKDQERDTRDALLALESMCTTARSAGVKIGPVLKEIAELSSDVNRYGMGSTRSILLRAILPG